MRFVFAFMSSNNPRAGGMNVIQEHMTFLIDAGFDVKYYSYNHDILSKVQPSMDKRFQPIWYDDFRNDDVFIIPEEFIWMVYDLAFPKNIKYIILNQGIFASFFSGSIDYNQHKFAYDNAFAVLVNSYHTRIGVSKIFNTPKEKIYEFRIGIDKNLFYPEEKNNTACFLFHKNLLFSCFMEVYFKGKYPDWELIRIENLPRHETAKILRKSKLFLSFGGPEGFGLPPLEAAFCNCKIIGFDGYGGAEYFKEPIFTKIPFYDHFEFIDKLDEVISNIDYWHIKDQEYVEYLKFIYNIDQAKESILNFYQEIKNLLT